MPVLLNPDGTEEFVGPSRVESALASGYTARSGDTTSIRNPSGSVTTVATEDAGQAYGPGTSDVDAGTRLQGLQGQWDDEEYGGLGGGAAAAGLGFARGATFGLSDLLVDDETAAGYSRENPGVDLASNIAGGLVTGGVSGLSKGALALGAKLAPGSKAAASLIAGGVEGSAFGAGQATSNLILRNEPLTAESVFTEYGTQIFLGGAAGGAGGLIGHGLGTAGDKLLGKSASRLAKDADVEKAMAANLSGVPIDSAQGRVLTQDFVHGLDQATKHADEIVSKATVGGAADVPSETLVRSYRLSKQWLDDNLEHHVARASAGDYAPEMTELVKATKRKASRMYSELQEPLDALGRPKLAQRGGNAAVKALGPDEMRGLAKKLVDYRNLARQLDEAIPGRPGLGVGEPGDEVLALERFASGTNTAKLAGPDISDAAKAYTAAKDTLFDKLYVQGKPGKRQLDILAELDADQATEVAKAYSQFIKHGDDLAKMAGSDLGPQAAKLTQELDRIKKAMSTLTISGGESAGMSAVDMMVGMGVVNEVIPDIDGPADEVLKVWLASRFMKRAGTAGAPGKGRSKVVDWIRGTAGRIGYRGGAQGGGVVGGGIRGAAGATGARFIVDKILGNTSGLAKATGRAVARTEATVGKLLQAAGKSTAKATPFLPNAFLKQMRFADLEHEAGTSAYEQRAREIRANVANSYGLQKTVWQNLGEMAMTHPGVADKTIAHANRVMQFLNAKLPRDPGVVMRLGKSNWKASPQDEAKAARYMRAALDPDGELERFANLDMSPEGAETLRVLYPAKFSKFQEHIAANLPALANKLSYQQQIQMSVLFNVPVTSLMRPEVVRQVQATFAADAASQPVSQTPPGANPSPLSPAQELLTR